MEVYFEVDIARLLEIFAASVSVDTARQKVLSALRMEKYIAILFNTIIGIKISNSAI